ncbi:ASCH domain-containing protein [Carnobacterium gallinarum]|uniref:ASCH domain-containing protein n=1 Tax=Carnobacterium gallinarum TaxID=2749 RepID=UPI00055081B9|nr:ASCH domain-containing protein [Carnobacterium gallinarum]
MENESANKLWENFRMQNPSAPLTCEAWSFGNTKEMADELAELVLEGLKTATSSAFCFYEIDNEPVPKVGDYSIVLNGNDEAIGIIQNRKVTILAFDEVSEEIAIEEGEGDRTLEYWRKVHEEFFKRAFEEYDQLFSTDIMVVCEQFELVYAA